MKTMKKEITLKEKIGLIDKVKGEHRHREIKHNKAVWVVTILITIISSVAGSVIIGGIGILIGLVLGFVSLLIGSYAIERRITITRF